MADDGPILSDIAGRYASALFELATEAKAVEAVSHDLATFEAMIRESIDLDRLVRNPVFSAEEQLAGLSALLDRAGISGLAGNFLRLVASKRRLFAVRDMIRAYARLADERAGILRAEVRVAEPLSNKNRAAVKEALDALTGKSVAVAETVDPALIGGIVVKLGSRMVDASVRTKLNSLKIAMKEVG